MEFETTNEFEEVEEFVAKPIGVYVKRDGSGKVIDINSNLFIKDLTDWEKIDEGFGDKYAHAQNHYKKADSN